MTGGFYILDRKQVEPHLSGRRISDGQVPASGRPIEQRSVSYRFLKITLVNEMRLSALGRNDKDVVLSGF